ncbi:hypothetical protein ACIQU2_27400 [Pseudomonas sp. NPDC098740]|uniref:hypothetical protein n=1 Tax=Pseudomonas sp. NPDC098740 TaxID=3364486 RepID=UPI00383A41FA
MPMIDSDKFKTELDNFDAARQAWRAAVETLPKDNSASDWQELERLSLAVGRARVEMDSLAWVVACKLFDEVERARRPE